MQSLPRAQTSDRPGVTDEMTTAILYGQKDVRIERRSTPSPAPGEVLIAVDAALTDGTDLKVYRRGYHARMIVPPSPFGHEFSGRIAAIGVGVAGWQVGDSVVAANSAPCGECFHCTRDEESLCENLVFVNGAYAEYLLLPARLVEKNLLHVTAGFPMFLAAFTEPLACVVKGIRDLGIAKGQSLAVIGSGAIGLMAAQVAAQAGSSVILIGRRHLEKAAALGIQAEMAASEPAGLAKQLRSLTGERGPDLVFEATGVPAVWEQAIMAVRKGGAVNLFGGCPAGTQVSFDTNRMHYDELTLKSSFHHTPADVRSAFNLILTGRLNLEILLDGEEPLGRLPAVLEEMDLRKRTLKTVIRPGT